MFYLVLGIMHIKIGKWGGDFSFKHKKVIALKHDTFFLIDYFIVIVNIIFIKN